MSFTFRTNFKNITYEYYLIQSKSLLEWKLNEKRAKIPKLINAFDRTHSHPLIREISNVDPILIQILYIYTLEVN